MNQKTEINRKEKRRATTMAGGKEQNILKFLSRRAKDLPTMKDPVTGEIFNHTRALREAYMFKGTAGVDEYVSQVSAVSMRDMSPKAHIRFYGRMLVGYYRIMNWLKR